eukprot:7279709-Pyramimonas_sp.AAC.1
MTESKVCLRHVGALGATMLPPASERQLGSPGSEESMLESPRRARGVLSCSSNTPRSPRI